MSFFLRLLVSRSQLRMRVSFFRDLLSLNFLEVEFRECSEPVIRGFVGRLECLGVRNELDEVKPPSLFEARGFFSMLCE